MQQVLWAPLTAFAVALAATAWLARSRISTLALDHPNRRSLHASPIPRTGGVGLFAGALCAWLVMRAGLPPVLWSGLGLLFLVSLLDDFRGIPVLPRLGAHLVAAGMLASGLLLADFGAPAAVIGAIAIAWMINLYNFMDGSDGLAGGMTLIGFSFYGAAAWLNGSTAFAAINFSVAAAAAAFLVFNFHPARIFLGDAGSVPLGFLGASFGLLGWLQRDWALWFPLVVFSPFIVDATVTLARRLARGARVWEAHRDHYYQRLVRMGWGHGKTAWAEYLLMLCCGIGALATLGRPPAMQLALLAAAILAYGILIAAIERTWRAYTADRAS